MRNLLSSAVERKSTLTSSETQIKEPVHHDPPLSAPERAHERVPTEVWEMIFIECTAISDEVPLGDHIGSLFLPPDFQALTLTGVCRAWRFLALATPRLWCDIVVVWGVSKPYNVQRIQHYHLSSKSSPISLYVGPGRDFSAVKLAELGKMFQNAQVRRIVLLFSSELQNPPNSFLEWLPAPADIWILQTANYGHIPYPHIPPAHCRALKRLVLDKASAAFKDKIKVEEYIICVPARQPIGRPHVFLPDSINTLQTLALHGASLYHESYDSAAEPIPFPHVHTIKMGLEFLAKHFLMLYRLPSLRRIEVIMASDFTNNDWDLFKERICISNITELAFHSVNGCILPTINHHITDFDSVSILELYGTSVEPVLNHLIGKYDGGHQVYPLLNNLIIRSYNGGGECVISFVQKRRAAQYRPFSPNGAPPEIRLEGCTRMSFETRMELRALCHND